MFSVWIAIGDLSRRHVEQTRGLGLHPARLFQRGDDFLAFVEVGVVQIQLLDRAAIRRDFFVYAGEQDGIAVDYVAFGHHRGALQTVLQFAHVSGPIMMHEDAQRGIGQVQLPSLLRADFFHQEARAISGMSSMRSRSGGRNSGITLRR